MDPASPADFRTWIESDEIAIPDAWMTRAGGNRTAGMRRFRDGNGREHVIGGRAARDTITASREWIHDRDAAIARWADRRAGKAKVRVFQQPLDEDERAYGDPIVWTGKLAGGTWPDVNSDSETDNAMITLTIEPYGEVA